jgi:lysozyme
MKIGAKGLSLVKRWEGLRTRAYLDTGGVWTIGFGSTRGVKEGQEITAKDAEALLRVDLADAEKAVARYVKVPLTQTQFDVLVSFVFNLGSGNFANSTLLKKLNAGSYSSVPTELLRWVYDNGKYIAGLERRRRDEADMWRMSGPLPARIPPPPDIEPVPEKLTWLQRFFRAGT